MFPDDMNDWSQKNFEDAKNFFGRIVKNNINRHDKMLDENETFKQERVKPLGKDDLIDLKILLESSKSIDDFIKQM